MDKITFDSDKDLMDGVVDSMAAAVVTTGAIKSPNIVTESLAFTKKLANEAVVKVGGGNFQNKVNQSYKIVAKKKGRKPADEVVQEDLGEDVKTAKYKVGGKEFDNPEDFFAEVERIKNEGIDAEINVENDMEAAELAAEMLEEGKPSYKIGDQVYETKEDFVEAVKQVQDQEKVPNIEIKNDQETTQQVTDILGPEKAKSVLSEQKVEGEEVTPQPKKEAVKKADTEPEAVKRVTNEKGKIDFEQVELQEGESMGDVVLNTIEELDESKNPTEIGRAYAKVQEQVAEAQKPQIIQALKDKQQAYKDYQSKIVEEGEMAAMEEGVEPDVKQEGVEEGDLVESPKVPQQPTEEMPPTEPPVEVPTEEDVGDETNVRRLGERALKSKNLPEDIKKRLADRGNLEYAVRGKKVTKAAAREIIGIYRKSGNLDAVKSEILNLNNDIPGDTRTALGVEYYKVLSQLESTTTDSALKVKYHEDKTDVIESQMIEGTKAGQQVQSFVQWQEVMGNDPDVLKTLRRRESNRRNKKWLDETGDEITSIKALLDYIFESQEFDERIDAEVKKRVNKFVDQQKKSRDRVARGKAKIHSGMEKLTNAIGAKVNFVEDNEVQGSVVEAIYEIADGVLDAYVIPNAEQLFIKMKELTRKYVSPREIDKLQDDIIKRVKADERYRQPQKREIKPEDIDKLVDRIYSRMLRASKPQLRSILNDYITELDRAGAVSDEAFQNLYAKAMGKDFISQKDEEIIENSARKINEAKDLHDNIVHLYERLIEESNKEKSDQAIIDKIEEEIDVQVKEYNKVYKEALKWRKKQLDVFANPRDIYHMFGTFIQGGLLTFRSLGINWTANIGTNLVRIGTNYVSMFIDSMAYGVGFAKNQIIAQLDPEKHAKVIRLLKERLPDQERTYDALAYSKGYVKGFPKGFREGLEQMSTGQMPSDLAGHDIYRSLKPLESMIDNYKMLTGQKKAMAREAILNVAEGILGINPEIVFRLLNFGDKPFRRGGEGGRLLEIASLKGLKGAELREFLFNPDEETMREVEMEGRRATLQEDNTIMRIMRSISRSMNDKIDVMGDGTTWGERQLKGLSFLVGKMIMPYKTIPTNFIWQAFTYLNPEISAILGANEAVRGNRRAAIDYFSRAAVGSIIKKSIGTLMGLGVMTLFPGGEEEDKSKRKKLRDASYDSKREGYRVNIDAFGRFLKGEDVTWKDGDRVQDVRAYGLMGQVAMAQAHMYTGMSPDEINTYLEETGYKDRLVDKPAMFGATVRTSLDQSFMAGAYSFMKALMEGGREADRMVVSMGKVMSSTVVPNWYADIAKWNDNYIRDTKERYVKMTDSQVKKEIINNLKVNTGLGEEDRPPIVSIYGEKVNRYNSKSWWNLIDPFKTDTYSPEFGVELMDVYLATKNVNVFPYSPNVNMSMKLGDTTVYVKLPTKLYSEYSQRMNTARTMILRSVVNSGTYIGNNMAGKAKMLEDANRSFMRSDLGEAAKQVFVAQNFPELLKLYSQQKKEEK